MKISTKTTYSYTLLARNAQINPQRKFLPLQWIALPTNPWSMGTKTAVFFGNIFMACIKTITLSKNFSKPTVWKCCIDDIFPYKTKVNQTSKPSLNKQIYIIQLLNSRPKHLTLRLCFQTRLYTKAQDLRKNLSLMQRHILNKRKPSCTHISPRVTLQMLKKDLSKEKP